MLHMLPLLLALLSLGRQLSPCLACQLPSDWRPLSESCRAELAEIIVYAKVLALHQEMYSMYNYLPWQYEASEGGLFYSAEIEMLCDQAWGSMLEVPAGSRLNLTGLGYFSCHSHTVMQDYSYFFFLRMDENYNLLPHGVNFQDAIFPDTQENRRMFSSLFQFSNCSQAQHVITFSSDWDIQEDNRLMCSSVQKALFEEEDQVKKLQQKVATLEKRNKQLRDRVKKVKRSLRQARKNNRHMEQINRKLNEKLSSAGGQIPHINSLKQENSHATYLKV
ncbi:coiled-coil domain-containing protein 3 isoform X1 [Pelodiscus sinensis]|uniref:Coiled-coil domain containing 3 n=1 Tax=Pelodiscus sinensis TaxID=13735 RepID=K7GBR5_PELSI|nr:coiled-coil domain-containing protein 3 isoform X1 [Pelodiscus sinensis]|eukprot:XP_006117161.1 coiled-coil domain-containing protein 3 isoform X1 [Pelodiscus sinensis]